LHLPGLELDRLVLQAAASRYIDCAIIPYKRVLTASFSRERIHETHLASELQGLGILRQLSLNRLSCVALTQGSLPLPLS
jgi:hypothetical protein